MTSEQLDAYMLVFRIEEITQRLRVNNVLPTQRNRSPSPAPEYDTSGRRINTREHRYRKSLQDERHRLVEAAFKVIPNYTPPHDYRRPDQFTEKVYIPVSDFPGVNFIGQLLGPRGSSLKAMNDRTGATIAIRGRGSVKEGKGRFLDSYTTDNLQEPLHCLITAGSQQKVDEAKELIQGVIETVVSTPEHANNRKRQQLRDLAIMNGTFRDDENDLQRNQVGRLIVCAGSQRQQAADHQHGQKTYDDHLEHEYKQLLSELEGSITDEAADQPSHSSLNRLPPWRLDRLDQGNRWA
ncbi:Branchpoint-bridging protein [Cladobotryum mycophilum]|uniref:Branchpoint-bridging protein n=1 Tax=Cladobotryum mycophilum TaxID=491253 RepID=A0ABR0S715_9HYPO